MANENRKLVTLERIEEIRPIENADRLEVAKVLGWEVVVPKNLYKPGEIVIYAEIDSFLPLDTRYEYLETTSKTKHKITGETGIRIKSVKLRGQVSQGLILSQELFPETFNCEVGQPLKELLNVKLWEVPETVGDLGTTRGRFHNVISKTDEIRCQSDDKFRKALIGHPYYITEKIDGMSITLVKEDGNIRLFTRR